MKIVETCSSSDQYGSRTETGKTQQMLPQMRQCYSFSGILEIIKKFILISNLPVLSNLRQAYAYTVWVKKVAP